MVVQLFASGSSSMTEMEILFDGLYTTPRLDHPECVAVMENGNVLAGTEHGELLEINVETGDLKLRGTTRGFLLGIAIGPDGSVFACDLLHSGIYRFTADGVSRFAEGPRIPNFLVVDRKYNRLLVTDSYSTDEPGPGIWEVDLHTGSARVWLDTPLYFANGICFSLDGRSLYVVETRRSRLLQVGINDDGSAGIEEVVAEELGPRPDGVAIGASGTVYVGCYAPSQVLSVDSGGRVRCVASDPSEEILSHPTNVAFRGGSLVTANLGRWHLSRIEVNDIDPGCDVLSNSPDREAR